MRCFNIARYSFLFTIILLISDITALSIGFILSILARVRLLGPVDPSIFLEIMAFSTSILVILLFSFNQYKQKRSLFDIYELSGITKSMALTVSIIIFYTFISKTSTIYSRFIILLSFAIGFLLIIVSRYFLRLILGFLRTRGFNIKRAYVASFPMSDTIKTKIKDNPYLGYKLVNSLKSADVAFISSDKKNINTIFSNPNIEFKIVPDIISSIAEPAKLDEFPDIPLSTISKSSTISSYIIIKRLIDIILSLSILLLTSPLLLLISIINVISYKRIFFKQKRIGKDLKQFTFYKFQTMNHGKKPTTEVNYLFKAKEDIRTTKFGRFLRRTCLDELPQLFNVLLGDMSIVGPRPHLKEELHFFKAWKTKRFEVKPGLTGLWQIGGRHELNSEKAAALDIYYINHMSLALDLKIILKTIPAIIFSRGRW